MKKIVGIGAGILTSLTYAPFAFAQNPIAATPVPVGLCPTGSVFAPLCNLGSSNFGKIIGNLIIAILIIAVIIALFFLIYGGIKWILSGGDKTAVEAARQHIVAAIVGLCITLLAFFILNVIMGLFGLTLTEFKLPTVFTQ